MPSTVILSSLSWNLTDDDDDDADSQCFQYVYEYRIINK